MSKRPDWNAIMDGQAQPGDNDLVIITRGSARLARSAIRSQNERDYYHNFGAAEQEIAAALAKPVLSSFKQLENLTTELSKCDDDCNSANGGACNCGAELFSKTHVIHSAEPPS